MRVKRKLTPWCKDAKKALIDKDMSMQELADKCGISAVYASKITSGVNVPSRDLLIKVCEVLDIECPEDDNDLISSVK